MTINPEQVDFVDAPIAIGTRSDNKELFFLGYSQEFDGLPVVSFDKSKKKRLILLDQILKNSQPNAWEWNQDAIDKIQKPEKP